MSISIVITTYFRKEDGAERVRVALAAAKSWKDYLKPFSNYIHLHVADDGSESKYLTFYMNALRRMWQHNLVTVSCQERHGVGASLNTGIRYALEFSAVYGYFVDDWSLTKSLDISDWVELLEEDTSVGCVRLGPPHPNTRGTITMYSQGWGLKLDRYSYAFSQRPALYHRRFHDHYGEHPEDCSALECERMYAERFCRLNTGPDIVYALPHSWEHLGDVSMSAVEP